MIAYLLLENGGKLKPENNADSLLLELGSAPSKLDIYPNPFQSTSQVKLQTANPFAATASYSLGRML